MSAKSAAILIILGISIAGCNLKQELGLASIPPVFVADLDLQSNEPQALEFEFGPKARYDLEYWLKLQGGPGSSESSTELIGVVRIYDADGEIRLEERFHEELSPSQIGGTLLRIESRSIGGHGPHKFIIQLDEQSQYLLSHYADFHVSLKRQPAFRLMY